MSNGMTATEQEAIAFFFREYPDGLDVEQILDAHAANEIGVELWSMFEPMRYEIPEAVNDLLHLINRIKKQGATL